MKLPCKWELVDEYMDRYREKMAAAAAAKAKTAVEKSYEPVSEQEVIILVSLDNMHSIPIAYDAEGAAAAVGYSSSTIRKAINRGDLTPHYANSKAVILREDLEAWVRSLPVYYEPSEDRL